MTTRAVGSHSSAGGLVPTQDFSSGRQAIQKLIDPASLDSFLEEYWQRKVLVVRKHDPHYFDDLLTVEDIDQLLASVPLPVSNINMGRSAVGVPEQAYSSGRYIDPSRVIGLHKDGNTLIMRAMHLWIPSLRALCDEMESFFHCSSQTNLYLTPANTQSSYPHWDAHDIFVIQITGRKRWLLHEPRLRLPLRSYEFDSSRHEVGPQVDEFTLEAGDMAYVPRGMVHNPIAAEYSVHVALGVLVKTWADVLKLMLESVVLENIELREQLPVRYGEHGFDVRTCASLFPNVIARLADLGTMREAVQRVSDGILKGRRTDTRSMLTRIACDGRVKPQSIVEVPPKSVAIVESNAGRGRALINGVELRVAPELLPIIELIAQ